MAQAEINHHQQDKPETDNHPQEDSPIDPHTDRLGYAFSGSQDVTRRFFEQ